MQKGVCMRCINKLLMGLLVMGVVFSTYSAETKRAIKPNGQVVTVRKDDVRRVYKAKARNTSQKSNWSKIKDLFL